jgi:hypothetical protein
MAATGSLPDLGNVRISPKEGRYGGPRVVYRNVTEPTITDCERNPSCVRHAFLECVATFHGYDYLAYPTKSNQLRKKLRESKEFEIVDYVAHAFKHVATGKGENPKLKAIEVIRAVRDYDRDDTPLAVLEKPLSPRVGSAPVPL